MQKRFIMGLALSATLFIGCGDKPKEEQKVVEPAPVASTATTQTEVNLASALFIN